MGRLLDVVPMKHALLQLLPQPPQFFASTLVSKQDAPHYVEPTPHVSAHAPAPHTSPGLHAVAHAPQLAGLCHGVDALFSAKRLTGSAGSVLGRSSSRRSPDR